MSQPRHRCRFCGQDIYWVSKEPIHSLMRPFSGWNHHPDDIPKGGSWTRCEDGRSPLPREICSYTKGEGDRCTNPVKWEDIAAEQFACGVHMRQYLSDREQELANERERRKKAEAEEVAKWELGFYQDAYRRLNALDPELFPLDDMPQLRWRGVSSDIRIDIIKLDRFVRDHVTQTVPEG